MSMTGAGLQSVIKTQLLSQSAFTVTDDSVFDQAAAAIASAIVTYIQDNAEVTVIIASGSSAGTYTGTIS